MDIWQSERAISTDSFGQFTHVDVFANGRSGFSLAVVAREAGAPADGRFTVATAEFNEIGDQSILFGYLRPFQTSLVGSIVNVTIPASLPRVGQEFAVERLTNGEWLIAFADGSTTSTTFQYDVRLARFGANAFLIDARLLGTFREPSRFEMSVDPANRAFFTYGVETLLTFESTYRDVIRMSVSEPKARPGGVNGEAQTLPLNTQLLDHDSYWTFSDGSSRVFWIERVVVSGAERFDLRSVELGADTAPVGSSTLLRSFTDGAGFPQIEVVKTSVAAFMAFNTGPGDITISINGNGFSFATSNISLASLLGIAGDTSQWLPKDLIELKNGGVALLWTDGGLHNVTVLDASGGLVATHRFDGFNLGSMTIDELSDGRIVVAYTDRTTSQPFADQVKTVILDPRPDVIIGSDGVDIILGKTGKPETIFGRGGDDTLDTRSGGGTLYGEGGEDVLQGGADSDRMFGGADNDELFGNGGADVLSGGAGADLIDGSLGQDFADYDDAAAAVIIALANTALSTGDAQGDRYRDIEGFNLSDFNDVFRGIGATGRHIVNGQNGDDQAIAASGGLIFNGGAGSDILFMTGTSVGGGFLSASTAFRGDDTGGPQGVDIIVFGLSPIAINIDLSGISSREGRVSYVFGGQTHFIHGDVEGIAGTNFDDVIRGSQYANSIAGGEGLDTLRGGDGNDRIFGGAGNDLLFGDVGADTLQGDAGDDRFYVDETGDRVIEAVGGGSDRVLASANWSLASGQEIELITTTTTLGTSAISLFGNEFDQRLIGNAGVNQLNGRGGADRLEGLGGNDVYYVDNVDDLVFETAGNGSDRLLSFVSYTIAAGQEMELITTNDVRGAAAINLTGNEISQRIIGNDGVNVLRGLGGVDTLEGFGGADVLEGGIGADTLTGGLGADRFAFTALGQGTDVIRDFVSGLDDVQLTGSAFGLATGALAASAFVANATGFTSTAQRLWYNTATDVLRFDSNGSAAGGTVQTFASFSTTPTMVMTAADFVIV
jgi:Ca2+-binding RTX toxin-like protein